MDAQAILRLVRGETADASVIPDERVQLGQAVIPSVRWECDEVFLGEAFGNLGEFFESRLKDRTPSQAFNAGFTAAQLAIMGGLINNPEHLS